MDRCYLEGGFRGVLCSLGFGFVLCDVLFSDVGEVRESFNRNCRWRWRGG